MHVGYSKFSASRDDLRLDLLQYHHIHMAHQPEIDRRAAILMMMDFFDQITRRLDNEEEVPPPKWQLTFMSILMILMFAALITDRIAPDHTFVIALAFCMVTGIVDAKDGLKGFANEGVLTVMVRNTMQTHQCALDMQMLQLLAIRLTVLLTNHLLCLYYFL